VFTLLQPLLCLLPSATWDSGEIIFLKIAAIFFLVLLNGLFVASEFAIVKIRPSQLEALLEEKTPQAARARHIISHLDAYLSATQLGITLASLGLGWIGEPFLNSLFTPLLFSVGITSEKIIASCSLRWLLPSSPFFILSWVNSLQKLSPFENRFKQPCGSALF